MAILGICLMSMSACNTYRVVPKEYEGRVNKNLTYVEAKDKLGAHQGDWVVWGGEVLKATRLSNKTRVEVLQLPLTDDLIPASERAESSGRFLAFDTHGDILDPAVLQEGTRVTIVGQIQKPVMASTDLGSHEYPAIDIRDMTIWDKKMSRSWGYPYYGPYYGHYYYGYRPYVFWEGMRVPGS
jgi:outer membrane lipoprotein